MAEPKAYKAKLADFKPDQNNLNRHTQRGQRLVENSQRKRGFGRPGFAANDGTVLGGNLSVMEVATDIGLGDGEVFVVESDGNIPIIHLRTDIEAGSDEATLLAAEDNHAALKSINYDPEMLLAEIERGIEFDGIFEDDEIKEILGELGEDGIKDENYVRSVESPEYIPTGEQPDISQLFDNSKTVSLIEAIDKTENVTQQEREFLRIAAQRHTVLSFKDIAEYYAHADEQVQALMEDSALVIIDFDKAISQGFVQMTQEIADMVKDEHGDE